ncbi:secreted protein [Streptomyces albus]|uniref:Secreted protein n=1 Tax=Streptomyces albus (strain ATCC 21838 / DSM 41398 / FERM P-419 / JCM 4703 / NBRC 107858) TaxID=1081613 RepID=A0A0B5F035_STRA4|nr:secreted protein [Streptomyces albus]AOU81742.1 secreted protein [Streptomyces albus]AYN37432.1 hypothetical protein DUI70_6940 [Streptomyces albus]
MPQRPKLPFTGPTAWSSNRRAAAAALALVVLLAATAAVALLTRDDSSPPRPDTTMPPQAASSKPAATPGGARGVDRPARIAEPIAFAEAAAAMLWSYDTRTVSRKQQLDGMRAWMTPEGAYADWDSVAHQVPDPLLWDRMADHGQRASAKATEGHYPSAFKQALADDPSALTEAYIYAVTVNGHQKIAWKSGQGGAEDRAVTLAVQCRPGRDCRLAAVAPQVAP